MTETRDRNPTDIHIEDLAHVYKRHVQGAIIRSCASGLLWGCCWFAYHIGMIQIEKFIGVSFSVLFLILVNPPTLWILKHIDNHRYFGYFSLFINLLEIVGYTFIIHFIGGIGATFLLPLYAALIVYVGVVAPRRLPFIIAGFCSICFSLMVICEHYGILQTYKIYPSFYLPWPDQIMIMVVNANLLFVVAFISSYTALLLKRNRDRLRRQNEDLNLALQKASESDRLKSEFLANVSHELRTPLNAIIGFSELLECQYPGKLDENQKEYIRDINTSGQHLLAIINDILDLSKVEAGKIRMEPADVPLAPLFDNSLAVFNEKALKHRIRLSTDVGGCPETIRADELRLKQIVYNLLSNAVKFTPDGGQVILSARHLTRRDNHWFTKSGEAVSLPAGTDQEWMNHEQVVDIAVTDTGIGLKKENLERIFKPFEQVDGSTTRRYQGTGLGLSLARRFAELHGGYLCVESEGEDKGSSFHCVIPA